MNLEIRTFAIRDAAAEEDEARLAAFLRTVDVERIDTSYADGAWRVLIQYRDLRRKEEREQIESAIMQALNQWRVEMARNLGCEREDVLSGALMSAIARYAPTTEIELAVLANSCGADAKGHGAALVQVVRQTMEDLVGEDA